MSVDPGHMVLYDRMRPALLADNYRIRASTEVRVDSDDVALGSETRYFDVVGPRFALPPGEIAGVYPPRNGHGTYHETFPHVVFGRRTLPWERDLDPADILVGPPAATPGGPDPLTAFRPWLALLLFEEDEIEVLRQQPLEDVLPASVRTVIEAPGGVVCDAISVRASVLFDVLPTPDELEVLSHVRQVNVDDRELSAGDSDGWFSVAMSSRLPAPDRKYRACVVSLEGRTDLFERLEAHLSRPLTIAPSVVLAAEHRVEVGGLARTFPGQFDDALEVARGGAGEGAAGASPSVNPTTSDASAHLEVGTIAGGAASAGIGTASESAAVLGDLERWVTVRPVEPMERLVLLASWTFESKGDRTFADLAQGLDVAMIGDRAEGVQVAGSGHVAIEMRDRAGTEQLAWYRGPLAPYPLTRDPDGPYHSADQCRRISPETGLEDVSYSAAFEVGRLLATSDSRLAQELMRWRRTAYRAARRVIARAGLDAHLAIADLTDVRVPLVPLLGSRVGRRLIEALPGIDRFETSLVQGAPGLDPAELTRAWRLADASQAEALLGGSRAADVGGVPVSTPGAAERADSLRGLRDGLLESLRRMGG